MLNRVFYNIFKSGLILASTVIIILISLVWSLTNSQTSHQILSRSGIYTRIDQDFKPYKQEQNFTPTYRNFLISALATSVVNPGWLQNLVENNLNQIGEWIKDEDSKTVYYIPISDLEISLKNQLDREVQAYIESSEEVEICSLEQEEKILEQGYELDKRICIPLDVYNKEVKLTQFLSQSSKESLVSTIIPRAKFDLDTNYYPISNLEDQAWLNQIQSFLNLFYENFLTLFLAFWVLFGLLLWFSRFSGNSLYREARSIFWGILTSTLVVTLSCVLIVWFNSFVADWLIDTFDIEFLSNQLTQSFSELTLRLVFNGFLLAIIISLVALGLVLGLKFLELYTIFKKHSHNPKLQKYKKEYDPTKATTIDSQFHQLRKGRLDSNVDFNQSLNIKQNIPDTSKLTAIPENSRDKTSNKDPKQNINQSEKSNYAQPPVQEIKPPVEEVESKPVIISSNKTKKPKNQRKWFS